MKKKLIIAFALFYFLYPTLSVFACSPRQPSLIIECDIRDDILQSDQICLNDDCTLEAKKYEYPQTREYTLYKNDNRIGQIAKGTVSSLGLYNNKTLWLAEKVCSNDFKDVMPAFQMISQNWQNKHRYFLNGDLIFTPYSQEKVAQLTEQNKNLQNCYYEKIDYVGDWIIIKETTRSYCHKIDSPISTCPTIAISPIAFIKYVTTNLNRQTWPYWISLVIFFSLLFYLKATEKLNIILQPNVWIFVILIPISWYHFVTKHPRWDIIFIWIAVFYFGLSLLVYGFKLIRKKKKEKRKTPSLNYYQWLTYKETKLGLLLIIFGFASYGLVIISEASSISEHEIDRNPLSYQPTLLINNNAQYTNKPNVTLTLKAKIRPTNIKIFEHPNKKRSYGQNFRSKIPWQLSSEPGLKTIFVKIEGYEQIISDTIILHYTPILNTIPPTTPNQFSAFARQITLDTQHDLQGLQLVFDNNETSIFISQLPNKQISLPNESGCLYIFGNKYAPQIQVIGTGDLTIPVILTKPSLAKDEVMVSGCISETFTKPLTAILSVNPASSTSLDKYVTIKTTLTPTYPFFTFKTKAGKGILNLYNNGHLLFPQEQADLPLITERVFIFDLEPNFNKQ